jgi:hypothetical protein
MATGNYTVKVVRSYAIGWIINHTDPNEVPESLRFEGQNDTLSSSLYLYRETAPGRSRLSGAPPGKMAWRLVSCVVGAMVVTVAYFVGLYSPGPEDHQDPKNLRILRRGRRDLR